ncbi:MAG: hypothetical protein WCP29_12820 [Acidobacteriota bacterium]
MNFGRLAAAAVVSWLTHLVVSGLVWGTLLSDVLRQHAAIVRAPGDMDLVLGYGASLFGFFVFAYGYTKGYEGGAGVVEGLRYGVLVGLMLAAFAGVWVYVVSPVSAALATALVIDTIIEMAAYGAIVGVIYKPIAGRR